MTGRDRAPDRRHWMDAVEGAVAHLLPYFLKLLALPFVGAREVLKRGALLAPGETRQHKAERIVKKSAHLVEQLQLVGGIIGHRGSKRSGHSMCLSAALCACQRSLRVHHTLPTCVQPRLDDAHSHAAHSFSPGVYPCRQFQHIIGVVVLRLEHPKLFA